MLLDIQKANALKDVGIKCTSIYLHTLYIYQESTSDKLILCMLVYLKM